MLMSLVIIHNVQNEKNNNNYINWAGDPSVPNGYPAKADVDILYNVNFIATLSATIVAL